jgi:ribosomal protein L22
MTPSKPGDPSQGKPAADEQTELEATEAKQAAATEAAAESPEGEPEAATRPRRRARAKKAEGTAAEVTGEQKDAAEAAVHEGSAEPTATDAEPDAGSGDDDAAQQEQPPSPARRRRSGAAADERAPAPAPTRRAKRPAGERVLVRATARYVRTSPRKARLVCDHIRGKSIQEARAILAHTPRAAARDWSKLLESAIANAEHNHELIGDDLRVFAVTADDGPTLKRFQPRAMGRATRIRKRTSHLTIMLTPKE